MLALQLAQLHETLNQLEAFKASFTLVALNPYEKETQEQPDSLVQPMGGSQDDQKVESEPKASSLSQRPQELRVEPVQADDDCFFMRYDCFESYLLRWKALASFSFWQTPLALFKECPSKTLSQAMEYYYPAVALTPLAFVYMVYGYLLPLFFFLLLKVLAMLLFKRKKEPVQNQVE
jgi:hypothetical protein